MVNILRTKNITRNVFWPPDRCVGTQWIFIRCFASSPAGRISRNCWNSTRRWIWDDWDISTSTKWTRTSWTKSIEINDTPIDESVEQSSSVHVFVSLGCWTLREEVWNSCHTSSFESISSTCCPLGLDDGERRIVFAWFLSFPGQRSTSVEWLQRIASQMFPPFSTHVSDGCSADLGIDSEQSQSSISFSRREDLRRDSSLARRERCPLLSDLSSIRSSTRLARLDEYIRLHLLRHLQRPRFTVDAVSIGFRRGTIALGHSMCLGTRSRSPLFSRGRRNRTGHGWMGLS